MPLLENFKVVGMAAFLDCYDAVMDSAQTEPSLKHNEGQGIDGEESESEGD